MASKQIVMASFNGAIFFSNNLHVQKVSILPYYKCQKGEKLKIGDDNMANVYLFPHGDREYHACIAENPAEESAILMVEEGSYPVEVWWTRHDMNMDRLWASEVCENREDLVKLLDFLGECGHVIEELWTYKDKESTNEALAHLFDICYERKMEQLRAAIDDMWAWDDENCDGDCNHCTNSCEADDNKDGVLVVPDEPDEKFPF